MKPLRQRKHDRLTWGGSPSREEIAVDHAVAPFDRVAREMEGIWGVDRLPHLVSPETAAKFGRTLGSLNEAITANDPDRAADRAAACIRGLRAMDAEARQAGHRPPDPIVIETQQGDHHFGVLIDGAQLAIAQAQRPGLAIYTLQEVSVALQWLDKQALVSGVKQAFPGATVTAIRHRPKQEDFEDAIPF